MRAEGLCDYGGVHGGRGEKNEGLFERGEVVMDFTTDYATIARFVGWKGQDTYRDGANRCSLV